MWQKWDLLSGQISEKPNKLGQRGRKTEEIRKLGKFRIWEICETERMEDWEFWEIRVLGELEIRKFGKSETKKQLEKKKNGEEKK